MIGPGWRAAAAAFAGSGLAAVFANPAVGADAGCGRDLGGAQRVDSPRYIVVFAPRPAPWALDRHFAIDLEVCPKAGVPMPDQVRVDARMPEHGHGMNYRPSVHAQGPGRWRAEGLLLHMAGRWELSFELQRGEQVERLTQNLRVR